jgi:osmotically-inducible protein OsmY
MFGIALGPLAQYALDPVSGRARRARLRDQGNAAVHRLERRLARAGRHAASDAVGRARRALHPHPGPPPDDATLVDRVESRLFLRHRRFKGRINLDARDATVTLRGELDSQREIDEVMEAVRGIDGVAGVRSLLHVHGTPAPNKAVAIAIDGWDPWS